jgi:phosphatidylglycerophosphatase C
MRYPAAVEVLSADRLWARIALAAQSEDGGVIATDGDGTLWSGDVGEDLFHALVEHGAITDLADRAMRREAREHALSDAGVGAEVARRLFAAYLEGRLPEERMCEVVAWAFAGQSRREVETFARDALAQAGLESRMHAEVLDILGRARRAGLEVFLVSASPLAVVVAAGALAGFDEAHVVAARSVYEREVMAAEVERPIPYGPGKVARLRERIGPRTPLYAAFGDNAFDVALLSSARVGVAVRPKARLRERATEIPGLAELERQPAG